MEELFNIPDDAFVFSFKQNQTETDMDGTESALAQLNFVEHLVGKDNILFTCLGRHENGKNKVVHHHFVIISSVVPTMTDSTKSTTIKRYCDKYEVERNLIGTSRNQKIDITRPTWESLAYPLKEGLGYYDEKQIQKSWFYKNLSRGMYVTLKDLGNDLYLKKLAENERRDKYEEKKKGAFLDYHEFTKNNASKTYQEAKEKASQYYLWLELGNRPTTSNMMEYIKASALENGLITFLDLMK